MAMETGKSFVHIYGYEDGNPITVTTRTPEGKYRSTNFTLLSVLFQKETAGGSITLRIWAIIEGIRYLLFDESPFSNQYYYNKIESEFPGRTDIEVEVDGVIGKYSVAIFLGI